MNTETFALQIVEANHTENAFWTLAVGEYGSKDEMDEYFREIPRAPREDYSMDATDRDYIVDKVIDGDVVAEKFVSAETVERITGRKIGRMRAGAKNSLHAEIRRFDLKKALAE